MKKTISFLLILTNVLLLTACSDKNEPIDSGETTVKTAVIINKEEAIEVINRNPNMTADDSFEVGITPNIDKISSFVLHYAPRQSNKDFYDDFLSMYEYLFPDHELNNDYFLYYGKNSYVEFDDDGNMTSDLKKANDNYADIISNEEDVLYFLYDESWYGADHTKNQVCAEFTSPICNDLSRFNKGRTAQISQTDISLESFNPKYYFESVGKYSPDSSASFMLADKEVPINEAVDYFESYINNLPYPEDPILDMCVVSVDVLKLNDDIYGYCFTTTKRYGGIPFDSMESGTAYSDFKNYSFVLGQGFMVESNDVDYVYGIYRSQTISNFKEYSEMISLENASEIISSSLTQNVVFEVKKAELVYSEKSVDGLNVDVDDYIQPTAAAWKFTLFNPNDNLTYVCYVDAANGENFRYYTTEK